MSDGEVWAKLSEDDKRALKRFITGQIQNVLANEHGIGGSKGVKDALQLEVTKYLDKKLDSDAFALRAGEAILKASRIFSADIIKLAIEKAAKALVGKKVGEAVDRITIHINISEDPPEGAPENFGRF